MSIKTTKRTVKVKNGKYVITKSIENQIKKTTIEVFNEDIRLFRYRPINEYTINALLYDDFYASQPSTFNDPYDTSIYYDQNVLMKELEKIYTDIDEKTIYENYEQILNLINKNTSYIASLSTNKDSPVMWAHYADLGKGFLLEYSYKDLRELALNYTKDVTEQAYNLLGSEINDKDIKELHNRPVFFPVDYSKTGVNITEYLIDTIKKYNVITMDNPENVNEVILKEFSTKEEQIKLNNFLYGTNSIKDISWKYENEWRILVPSHPFETQHKSIGKLVPKSIYMGEFISDGNKFLISEIAKKKNIDLFQMYTKHINKSNRLFFKKM